MNRRKLTWLAASLLLFFTATLAAQDDKPGMSRPGKGILDVVVHDEDGKPLKGANVSVPGFRSTTGVGGTARFGLLPGRYAVRVTKSGFRGKRVTAGVRPGETTTTRVVLEKLPPRAKAE